MENKEEKRKSTATSEEVLAATPSLEEVLAAIPEEELTDPKLCKIAVMKDGFALKYVDEEDLKEFYKIALSKELQKNK
jgi:hypothetical protein